MGFPGSTSGKDPVCQWRRFKRPWFDPWVGRFPGEGRGIPLQYSCLEKSIDRAAWRAAVLRVMKESDTTQVT